MYVTWKYLNILRIDDHFFDHFFPDFWNLFRFLSKDVFSVLLLTQANNKILFPHFCVFFLIKDVICDGAEFGNFWYY